MFLSSNRVITKSIFSQIIKNKLKLKILINFKCEDFQAHIQIKRTYIEATTITLISKQHVSKQL